MTAIDLLEDQHREVEDLFEQFEALDDDDEAGREALFTEMADKLAIHSTIEERLFYPAVLDRTTEGMLREAVEEHLTVKRLLADLLEMEASSPNFNAKMKLLKDAVEQHVEQEEGGLFPKARKILDDNEQEALAQEMKSLEESLADEGAPRNAIPAQTDQAASLEV